MAVGLWVMASGVRGVRIRLADMRPDLQYFRRMLRIGAPASVEMTGRAVSVNLLLIVVGAFSTPVVAAFGIGVRVFSVIFLPAIAVARGVETMTGQNVGAGKPDRAATAANFAARTTFLVLAAVGVVVWVAARPIVALFSPNPVVVDGGVTFLRYVAPSFGFVGVMRAYTGSFRGAGKTLTAAALAVFSLGVVRLPVAVVGARTSGPEGVWVAFLVSNVAGAVVAYLWYRRGTWRGANLADAPATPADD
jgi:Na+-driven multidrug efflux pump